MYKAYVFLKKGFVTATSYRLSFVLGLFSLFLSVAQMGFLAAFVANGQPLPQLQGYGGSLLAYLMSGTVFMGFVSLALSSFQQTIRSEQQMGTLPYLLTSPSPMLSVLLLSSLWSLLWNLLTTAAVLGIATLVFDTTLTINVTALAATLLLTTLCLGGIGLVSAGIIVVTKQGDPISWMLTTVASFTSGVIFPVEVLPRWLQWVSQALPTTYALNALRKALLVGSGLGDLRADLMPLVWMALVTMPLGWLTFQWGYNRARERGSLADY